MVSMEWESRLGRRLRVRDLYILIDDGEVGQHGQGGAPTQIRREIMEYRPAMFHPK
jgi:hypothetical protein